MLDKLPAGLSFHGYVNADIVTTEALGAKREKEEDADNAQTAEDPIPMPSRAKKMHLIHLRQLAGTHEEIEQALNVLMSYGKSMQPLLTKRTQARIADFAAKFVICWHAFL